VESLSFLEITTGSLFVYLSPPLLCFPLPRAASAIPAMCAAPAVPALLWAKPRATPTSTPPLPGLALASPYLATSPAVCLSRASPPLAVAAMPAPPPASGDPTHHSPTVPLPSRPCAVSLRVLHDALPLPSFAVLPRAPPVRQLLLGAATPSSGPRTPPIASLAHALAFAHLFATQFSLLRPSPLTCQTQGHGTGYMT
jgi:hypothetical protein